MTRSKTLMALSAVSCLVLPWPLAAESRLGADAQRATARVMFKIVIPQVLSLDPRHTLSLGGTQLERHEILLSSAGRHSVAQVAVCMRPAARQDATLSCTVSMP